MKKFKLRKFYGGCLTFLILLYLEIVFRVLLNVPIATSSFGYTLLLSAVVSLTVSFCQGKISYLFSLAVITFVYILQFCMARIFSFYFDWSLILASSQVASFAKDGIILVLQNVLGIFLLLLPLVILIINKRVIVKNNKWWIGKVIGICLLVVSFLLIMQGGKDDVNSAYSLFWKKDNVELATDKFGVFNSFVIDTSKHLTGFEETIEIDKNLKKEKDIDNNKVYKYNNLDIDFQSLIDNETDSTIKQMHEYFAGETGTLQNEYTSYFKGKNLILFMAESFNEIAVSEELTPTLYKLVHGGFTFTNFYTPTISSTIGGEFQELNGLVAASGFLSPWKAGKNAFPMSIARSFQKLNYSTFAYHDHNYTFQSRNNYLSALGFTNFTGCKNGLENKINCGIWPESDVEMIEATVDDYLNSDGNFFTYYVTVSGHGDYNFSQSAMAKKHQAEVDNLNYSEKVKAYLAAQIELNNALEVLIQKLSDKEVLDDTVIALVGDHYPYYLSVDEVNEVASYKKDDVVEINHSNFILWNSKMESKVIDKVGSQIDVLPTLYNLFGIDYDSRLIIGKDILSTEEGLAIFGNRSWVSDKGTYYAKSNEFVLKDGEKIEENYVKDMNRKVNNKVAMSGYILTKDYYRKVLGD